MSSFKISFYFSFRTKLCPSCHFSLQTLQGPFKSSESLKCDNKMILFALITACHDRSHSYLCIQTQLACDDISEQRTLRQAINNTDELQTAAAIIPEPLMDRILIVSANTRLTFYMTLEASLHTYNGCFFHTVCQNNEAESGGGGWVLGRRSRRDKLL